MTRLPGDSSDAPVMTQIHDRATETLRSLDPMSAELIQNRKMDALGQLAGGITHDFKNVLQTIMSNIDLIDARANEPEQVRRLAASLMRVAEHGVALTQRLLAFTHKESLKLDAVYLPAVLEDISELLGRSLGAMVQVKVDPLAEDLWQPLVDAGQLELALLNLGINARDAMNGPGALRLGARNASIPKGDRRSPTNAAVQLPFADRRGPPIALPCGDYVLVVVSDTGSGMDEATLARATEPLFTTKPVGKGSGLGLWMVHGFATQHGGALRLRSRPGQGTTVELWLPRAIRVAAQSSPPPAPSAPSDA